MDLRLCCCACVVTPSGTDLLQIVQCWDELNGKLIIKFHFTVFVCRLTD